ncbi:MAG TPA: hypothetical protein VFW45_08215 [Candidatus Polarisedimenticolia bacterium]|nr:hypothetical protein [Candidatus Polarisedimenticolia bacterium]
MTRKPCKAWLALFVLAIAVAPVCAAGSGKEPGAKGKPAPAMEVEPSPPLALDVKMVKLQKNSNGGVASLNLDALASVELKEVTVTVTLPPNVSFADGSHVFTQTVDLSAGQDLKIPKDLLVAKDGKYIVSVEAAGTTTKGKAVRRGLSYRLLVGAQDTLPPVKDGAIEYQGVSDGGN